MHAVNISWKYQATNSFSALGLITLFLSFFVKEMFIFRVQIWSRVRQRRRFRKTVEGWLEGKTGHRRRRVSSLKSVASEQERPGHLFFLNNRFYFLRSEKHVGSAETTSVDREEPESSTAGTLGSYSHAARILRRASAPLRLGYRPGEFSRRFPRA